MRQLAIALALVGCASEPLPIPPEPPAVRIVAVDRGCSWTNRIVLNVDDNLSPPTARQIVRHNSRWVSRCATPVGE